MDKKKISILIVLLILSSFGFTYADNHNHICDSECEIEEALTEYEADYEELEKLADELHQEILNHSTKGNNYFTEKSIENNIHPTNIEHHTCGYGGTSCRICYRESETRWCGCIFEFYRCCCGSYMGGKQIYCQEHS